MTGPYASVDDMPLTKEMGKDVTAVAGSADKAKVQLPLVAAEVVTWGTEQDMIRCSLALQLADGWYVSEPFQCVQPTSRTREHLTGATITIDGQRVQADIAVDGHASNMDNEPGETDYANAYTVVCSIDKLCSKTPGQ
jgi:hypothetical protein